MKTIKIPKTLVDECRAFSKKAVANSKHYNQKFITGNEDRNQFLGYMLEFAACWHWKQPYPKILKIGEVDLYDLKLNGLTFDVKASKGCYVNVKQFDKNKVDAYLFGTTRLLDYDSGLLFADFFGWIEAERLLRISELVEHPNGSRSYKVSRKSLNKMNLLINGGI